MCDNQYAARSSAAKFGRLGRERLGRRAPGYRRRRIARQAASAAPTTKSPGEGEDECDAVTKQEQPLLLDPKVGIPASAPEPPSTSSVASISPTAPAASSDEASASAAPDSSAPESGAPESLAPASATPESPAPESDPAASLAPASDTAPSLGPESDTAASLGPESPALPSEAPESERPASPAPESDPASPDDEQTHVELQRYPPMTSSNPH
jgi:preprotein translocase subunit SecD